jgi:AcrR family transcriptional regulator
MKADERKEAILRCATRLFSNQGYYQTHISDIIKEAQIARGTVYQYFTNKDDIFITIVDIFYEKWIDMVSFETAKIDFNAISAKDYFRHRIRQTLIFLSVDPDLCNIALRMGLGLPEKVSQTINRFEKRIMGIIADDLKLGQKNNNVSTTINVELTAASLTGALLRIAHHYFVKKRKQKGYTKKEIDVITNDFVNVFVEGIFFRKEESK